MARVPLRLVSAPLEVFGSAKEGSLTVSHNIPTSHPDFSNYQQPVISAGCYTDNAFALISAPYADRCMLELRTFTLDPSQPCHPVHHLSFPAPVLDTIFLSSGSNSILTLQVCTSSGVIFRILLPLNLLDSVDEIPSKWVSEHFIASMGSDKRTIQSQKLLNNFHTSQEGTISLASCADGRVIKVVWEGETQAARLSGSWHETILRPDTFFSRFFNRSTIADNPMQVLSMSTFGRSNRWQHTLGVTVSRDRKLRIWELGSDVCLRVIDLPSSLEISEGEYHSNSALVDQSSTEEGASSALSLFSAPPMLRLHATSEALYLIVYIPAPLPSGNFIICYQVNFEGKFTSVNNAGGATLGTIEIMWQRRCDDQTRGWNAELRDIALTTADGGIWNIWALWDAGGETLVKVTSGEERESSWSNVSSLNSYSPLHGFALDEDLRAVIKAEDMADFFMRRIVEPGRFSQSNLELALEKYEDILIEREGVLPEAIANTSMSDSIRQQILKIVGCTVSLEEETSTGALMHEAYRIALRKEWTTFVNLIEDQAVKERWPIGFVRGRVPSDEPFIISRGRLTLPAEEDRSSMLYRSTQSKNVQDNEQEASVIQMLVFAKRLFQAIHPAALEEFETRLREMLELQSSAPSESIADIVWTSEFQACIADEEVLQEDFALLGDSSAKFAITQVLDDIQYSPIQASNSSLESASNALTELDAALCSDAITQISSDRLTMARMVNILCFAIYVGYLPCEEGLDGEVTIEELIGDATAIYHRLYAFDLLARREGTVETVEKEPNQEEGDEADANIVALEIENMQMESNLTKANALRAVTKPVNLIHACILQRSIGKQVSLSGLNFQRRTHHFAVQTLQDLLFQEGRNIIPIELTSTLACLADDIIKSGHPSAAAAFVTLFPRTPASYFLLARTQLLLKDMESAAIAFEKVTPAFYRLKEEKSEFGSGLMHLLPPSVRRTTTTREALFHYYRRVVALYQHRPSPSHFHIAQFTKKAIDIIASDSDYYNTRKLQEARFNSLLALEWYEDAYIHLLDIPYPDEQKKLLPDLISRMCDQGQVDALLSFNFASLQVDVVNTLSFKARNSKSLEEIDFYFDLLYAFYVKRGDFKNAGATMWQMGILLRQMAQGARGLENNDEEVRHLSIIEARCYLACINVLSQLDIRDAWFVHDTGGAEEEEGMESKLTRYVPKSSFFGKTRDSLKIVNLYDIQRRYQIRLSQLELFANRPHYSTSVLTTDRNDANNVISLMTSNHDFERAFTIARLLNIDRSQIYTSLTDCCLDLNRWEQARKAQANEHPMLQSLLDDQEGTLNDNSRSGFLDRIDRCTTWTGSASQRAWKYLQLWLTMEEDNSTVLDRDSISGSLARYHLIVLNRILYWNRYSVVPAWLIDWLRLNEQELFIKSLLSHNLLEVALKESLEVISTAKMMLSKKRKHTACQVYLPYLLLDELLKRAEDSSSVTNGQGGKSMNNEASTSLVELRTLAKKLHESITTYKSELEKMQIQSIKEREEDQRRQKLYHQQQANQHEFANDVTMS